MLVRYVKTKKVYKENIKIFDKLLETNNINEFVDIITNHTHIYNGFHRDERSTKNWKEQYGVLLDFDSGTTIQQFAEKFKDTTYIVYHSRSNPDVDYDKFHVYFPLNEVNTDFALAKRLQVGIVLLAQHYGLNPDNGVKDLARYLFPSRKSGQNISDTFEYIYNSTGADIKETKLKEIKSIIKVKETSRDVKEYINNSKKVGNISEDIEKCVDWLTIWNKNNKISYNDWLYIGQALTNVENGLEYFLKISNATEPDKESNHTNFFKNLQRTTHSISIATLFYVAKQFGYVFIRKELTKVETILKTISDNLSSQYKNVLLKGFYIKDSNIFHYVVVHKDGQSSIFNSKINAKYINIYTKGNTELSNQIYIYLMENNNLMGDIHLSLVCGAKNGSNFTKILNQDVPEINNVERTRGIITLQTPLVKQSELSKTESNAWVMAVLEEIFVTKEESYLKVILEFLAQFVFEHRVESKLAIFLIGARGTGKGVFVDGILSQIYNVKKQKYTNNSQFTHWKEALKIIDVNEADTSGRYDLAKLYADIKDYSGSTSTSVRKLYQSPYDVDATAYFIVSQNDTYMYIPDKQASENQFLVCNFGEDKVKTKSQKWLDLGYTPIKMKHRLRAFIELTLAPIYAKMYPVRSNYRYGLEVPKTKAYNTFAQENNVSAKMEFEDFMELFINIYKNEVYSNSLINRYPTLEIDLLILKADKILTNSLIKGIIASGSFKKLKLKDIKTGLKNFSKAKDVNRVFKYAKNNVQKRGVLIDDYLKKEL